jgi:hypothetical protein
MGLGYGSEFQLLRFLGHHRHELDGIILRDTNINPELDYDMDWLDFPKNNKNKSLDGEYTGIGFLDEKFKSELSEKWNIYWPQSGNVQNWDAVIYCSPIVPNKNLKDKWVVIEAKAHIKEFEGIPCGAENISSKNKIAGAFELTKKRFKINTSNDWLKKYYQLANRLAFINFMLDNGIECSLLNIYFVNGWPSDPKNVPTVEIWKNKIDEAYSYLGINSNAKKYISGIFVNCI